MTPPLEQELTSRQMEIFALLAKGMSNREISELLEISNNTVKIHVAAILKAMGVSNRTEAAFAFKELITQPDQTGHAEAMLAEKVGRPPLVVVPFANLSGDTHYDLVSRGLVEDLTIYLAKWRWFPVISQLSADNFQSNQLNLNELQDQLGALYAVSGSLRVLGEKMRITVHLHDCRAGLEIWSGSFEGNLERVLSAQEDIAARVVSSLASGLIDAQGIMHQATAQAPTPHVDAWARTCRGLWLLSMRKQAQWREANENFSAAIALDPNFSMAWYGRARAAQLGLYEQWTDDAVAEQDNFAHSVTRGLEIDPMSAHAHHMAGMFNISQGTSGEAMAHLDKAITYNPSYAPSFSLLGQCWGMAGEADTCIAYTEEALKLNSHGSQAWIYRSVIGTALYTADRPNEAIKWLKESLQTFPDHPGSWLSLASAHVELGDLDAGHAALASLHKHRPNFSFPEHMKMYQSASKPELVEKQLRALAELNYRPDA